MLANFKVVLVETSHPGNIGAVARAMKNMGMDQLRLVNPKLFPHADATARASGADDVLREAVVYASLQDAIADCQIVPIIELMIHAGETVIVILRLKRG